MTTTKYTMVEKSKAYKPKPYAEDNYSSNKTFQLNLLMKDIEIVTTLAITTAFTKYLEDEAPEAINKEKVREMLIKFNKLEKEGVGKNLKSRITRKIDNLLICPITKLLPKRATNNKPPKIKKKAVKEEPTFHENDIEKI